MIGSNYSIIQLLTFSGIGLALFAISLVLGLFLYNLKSDNTLKAYFLNSFLGLFTLISFYSLFLAGGKTLNCVTIIVLLYLCISNKERFKMARLDFKALVPVLYIFPIVFILYGCYSLPKSIENDVRYYSKIAYSLAVFKQENLYHFYNAYDGGFNGIMPYHYNEMWLTSLFSSVFKIKSIIAIKYFTYPFLISCTLFGVLGFLKTKKFLFALLFIALSLLPFHLVSILGSGFTVYTEFWLRPNFIIYYYVLIPLFYYIHEKNWIKFYIFVILAGVNSIVTIPCLFGGAFILSLALLYTKEINKKEFWILNSLLLVTGLVMAILYSLFAPSLNLLTGQSIFAVISESLTVWKAVIYTIVTVIIECGFLVLVAMFLRRYVIKDERFKWMHFFVFIMIVIGVVLFQTLNQLDNSYQFPYFAFSASGFILILMIILSIETVKMNAVKIGLSVVIAVFCFSGSGSLFDLKSLNETLENKNLTKCEVSNSWINKVKLYFEKNPNAKGGFVLSKNDLYTYQPKSRNCLTSQMGSFISYFTDNCNLPSLTCADTLLSDKNANNKKQFIKAESWIKVFPLYANECDVNKYLRNGVVDYVICSNLNNNPDSTFLIIEDGESKYKLVCRK